MNTTTTSNRAVKDGSKTARVSQSQSNKARRGKPLPKDWWKDPSHRAGNFDLKKLFEGATWHPAEGLPPGTPVRVMPVRTRKDYPSAVEFRKALARQRERYIQIAPGHLRPRPIS